MNLIVIRLSMVAVLCSFSFTLFAQTKPPIDTSVFKSWTSVENPSITNDGKYFKYIIRNQPVGGRTLMVQAIKNNWKIELTGVNNFRFTNDSRKAVYVKSKDTLCLLELGNSLPQYIYNVKSYDLFIKDETEFLAYKLSTSERQLIIRNLETNAENTYRNVSDYAFSGDGRTLLTITEAIYDSDIVKSLNWIDLASENARTIWTGSNANSFVFDKENKQLVFMTQDGEGDQALWYYIAGNDKAVEIANSRSAGIESGLQVSLARPWRFTHDGKGFFFGLSEKPVETKPNGVMVDIWGYKDEKLQSEQFQNLSPKTYLAVINFSNCQIKRLQYEDESVQEIDADLGDVVFIIQNKGGGDEWNWNAKAKSKYYLVSIVDGKRKPIDGHSGFVQSGGNYFIFNDEGRTDCFSYDTRTGAIRNVTKNLSIPQIDDEYDQPDHKPKGLQLAAWVKNEEAVLIYDKFDIWKVDPKGIKPAVNITNGYGRKHNIVFRLTGNRRTTVAMSDTLILTAFNRHNKENGFYKKILNLKGDPELLSIAACTFYDPFYYSSLYSNFPLQKARDTSIYIVLKGSAYQSPNYFWTEDFKKFIPLSQVFPEKKFNWLTSELITYKTLKGITTQGALYKPENFDPKKKYPLIIHYYEKKSDRLNLYHEPAASKDEINIPWFVSHGYLVFTPDIHYRIGEPGQSCFDAVIGAAKQLMTFSWVDAKSIGIQGHSFGGYETQYLVTHTNIFKAAMAAAGITDLVSTYGSVWGVGPSKKGWAELDQGRIGATLWQKPDVYINNSPIFKADKVATPLLMMHNKDDGAVDFVQGLEFFTALRRLGKKAWMLQYENGDHSLDANSPESKDYTIRMTQFFDHYLKDSACPRWMLYGIPAKDKGIDTGYELVYEKDPKTGKWLTPKEGRLLTDEEKKKVEALKHRKPVTVTIE